jgi:hypothetical protein
LSRSSCCVSGNTRPMELALISSCRWCQAMHTTEGSAAEAGDRHGLHVMAAVGYHVLSMQCVT